MGAELKGIVFRAIETAAAAHAGQYRKGTRIPYIVHPLGVAEILIRAGCAEEVVAAGILHDTVEDTSLTIGDIGRDFGDRVARLVAGASEPDRGAEWELRKAHTIEYLRSAPTDVLLVCCADKLHNVLSLREDLEVEGEALWRRFNRSRDKQRWYYLELARVFSERATEEASAALARRFQEAVREVFG